jgi:hypothetical protein
MSVYRREMIVTVFWFFCKLFSLILYIYFFFIFFFDFSFRLVVDTLVLKCWSAQAWLLMAGVCNCLDAVHLTLYKETAGQCWAIGCGVCPTTGPSNLTLLPFGQHPHIRQFISQAIDHVNFLICTPTSLLKRKQRREVIDIDQIVSISLTLPTNYQTARSCVN